jgi:flagellar hook assembly protein FlgD
VAPGKRFSLDKGETRRLKVIVGTEQYARKRSEAALKQYETALRGNYPNPFDETTTLEYTLSQRREVTMPVYNVLGQRVETLVDARKNAGLHTVTWDGTNRYGDRVGSGVYFVRMEAGPTTETQKVVLVR